MLNRPSPVSASMRGGGDPCGSAACSAACTSRCRPLTVAPPDALSAHTSRARATSSHGSARSASRAAAAAAPPPSPRCSAMPSSHMDACRSCIVSRARGRPPTRAHGKSYAPVAPGSSPSPRPCCCCCCGIRDAAAVPSCAHAGMTVPSDANATWPWRPPPASP
eukprot:159476-Chlamydomonas_euryale.AAC.3